MSKWNLRPLEPGDIPFIIKTWLSNYRHNSMIGAVTDSEIYLAETENLIRSALNKFKTTIACDPVTPGLIFGYVVHDSDEKRDVDLVHYIYVKHKFREFGVAKDMVIRMRNWDNLIYSHEPDNWKKLIKIGNFKRINEKREKSIVRLFPCYNTYTYNPYYFFNPGGH